MSKAAPRQENQHVKSRSAAGKSTCQKPLRGTKINISKTRKKRPNRRHLVRITANQRSLCDPATLNLQEADGRKKDSGMCKNSRLPYGRSHFRASPAFGIYFPGADSPNQYSCIFIKNSFVTGYPHYSICRNS